MHDFVLTDLKKKKHIMLTTYKNKKYKYSCYTIPDAQKPVHFLSGPNF